MGWNFQRPKCSAWRLCILYECRYTWIRKSSCGWRHYCYLLEKDLIANLEIKTSKRIEIFEVFKLNALSSGRIKIGIFKALR